MFFPICIGDDVGIQPNGHYPGAWHMQLFQLGGHGGGFGIGGGFAVDSQVAAAQKVHHSPHNRVFGRTFDGPQLAVEKDIVIPAKAVQPRHAEGVIPHHMHGVHMLVQQRLPGAVKGTDPGFAGRHIIDAHIGLQVLAGHSFGGGVRVRVQYNSPAAQGGKRPCKANLLPVIGSFFAGCPAVQLRDGNGSHKLCYSNLFLGQHRTIPALRLKHRSGGCGT